MCLPDRAQNLYRPFRQKQLKMLMKIGFFRGSVLFLYGVFRQYITDLVVVFRRMGSFADHKVISVILRILVKLVFFVIKTVQNPGKAHTIVHIAENKKLCDIKSECRCIMRHRFDIRGIHIFDYRHGFGKRNKLRICQSI